MLDFNQYAQAIYFITRADPIQREQLKKRIEIEERKDNQWNK